jgi:hypothetical protein
MAQYTQILAQEYNDIQYTVTKVLGDKGYAIEPAFGYGTDTVSTSVIAGQEIAATEWDLLAKDIRSAYWYQSYSDYGVPAAVVQGADIFWSNVVAYQNAANTVLSNAVAATVGGSQRQTEQSVYQDLPGTDWPAVVVDTPVSKTTTRMFLWTNSTKMRQFFNAGGYLALIWSVTGTPTVGTKNYAYKNVLEATALTFTRVDWIGFGGLSQQSSIVAQTQTYTIDSGDTVDVASGTDPYTGTLPHKITRSCTVTMDCATAKITFTTTITDGATRTTYEGAVPAPKITLDARQLSFASTPFGTQPISGGIPIPGTVPVRTEGPTTATYSWG